MQTHVEGIMYGDSIRGYNVWRIIYRLHCSETHIDGTMYGD